MAKGFGGGTGAVKRMGKGAVQVAALLLGAAAMAGCVTNPATGKSEFVPFMPSKAEQVNLGLQSAPQFIQQGGGKLANPTVQAYVEAVGQRVLAAVPADQKQGYQFTYTIINDDVVNAFALPGGPVFISKGLLYKLHNEAELAFVLGHETGHVIAQHVGRQMSKQTELQVVLAAADAAAGGKDAGTGTQIGMQLGQFAGQMYLLKFSRDEESQADLLGLRYLVAAGYDPAGAIAVMKVLETAGGSSGGGTDWLSTHPSTGDRIQQLTALIQQHYPQALNNPAYRLEPQAFEQNVLRLQAN